MAANGVVWWRSATPNGVVSAWWVSRWSDRHACGQPSLIQDEVGSGGGRGRSWGQAAGLAERIGRGRVKRERAPVTVTATGRPRRPRDITRHNGRPDMSAGQSCCKRRPLSISTRCTGLPLGHNMQYRLDAAAVWHAERKRSLCVARRQRLQPTETLINHSSVITKRRNGRLVYTWGYEMCVNNVRRSSAAIEACAAPAARMHDKRQKPATGWIDLACIKSMHQQAPTAAACAACFERRADCSQNPSLSRYQLSSIMYMQRDG